jgi:Zn-dependent peptidase ImmA (M78 family)
MSVKTEVMMCACVHLLYVLMNHSAVCLIVACVFNFAAIDLINNLLQVKQRKRYTVAKSLAHVWLQVSDHCLVRLYHWSDASCCRGFYSHDGTGIG